MRSFKLSLILLLSVLLPLLGEASCRPDQLAALLREIDGDDHVYTRPIVPKRIALSLGKRLADRAFDISWRLWEAGFDRKSLREETRKLLVIAQDGRIPNERELHDFKQVRAKLKHLRAAFIAFDRSHECPAAVDDLAVYMGHFQDALKNGKKKEARAEAEGLLDLLDKDLEDGLEAAIRRFQPTKRSSFEDWVAERVKVLDEGTREPWVTPKEFHDLRKEVSRLVAVYDTLEALSPSPENRAAIIVLSTLNGRMGDEHNVLIKTKLNEGDDAYYKRNIRMPADILRLTRRLVAAMSGTGPQPVAKPR